MPTPERSTIYLCAVGDYSSGKNLSLEVLAEFVQHYFSVPCKVTSFSPRYVGSSLAQLSDSSDAYRKPSQKTILNSSRVKLALDETKKPLTDALASRRTRWRRMALWRSARPVRSGGSAS